MTGVTKVTTPKREERGLGNVEGDGGAQTLETETTQRPRGAVGVGAGEVRGPSRGRGREGVEGPVRITSTPGTPRTVPGGDDGGVVTQEGRRRRLRRRPVSGETTLETNGGNTGTPCIPSERRSASGASLS